jgi:NAD(P)-dependent dehydrogenase (short-subunit alcohol dehydrogenase family)
MAWFVGRVAIVTGAGSGIGRASALAFAREGASVVVSDVSDETGRETVELIEAAGGEALYVRTDVADETAVRELVAETTRAFGRLDFAHNNAGIGLARSTLVTELDANEFDRVVAVNLRGVFLCLKHQIPELLKQKESAIVITSSRSGLLGGPGNTAYVASKHAVNGLTKSVALEFSRRGLRVNAICPSYTETTMTKRHPKATLDYVVATHPMGRAALPEEMAEAVVWLCSPLASYVNGALLPLDGGSGILPADMGARELQRP